MEADEDLCFCGCEKPAWRVILSLQSTFRISEKSANAMYERAKANAPKYLKRGTVTT